MDNLLMTYKELYGEQKPKLVKSPLRICPLGAHVDHQVRKGFHAVISGKLPIGGLSLSAAVTTAYLMALAEVNGLKISKRELVF